MWWCNTGLVCVAEFRCGSWVGPGEGHRPAVPVNPLIPTLSPSWLCATASSAATTFAAKSGQLMRDMGASTAQLGSRLTFPSAVRAIPCRYPGEDCYLNASAISAPAVTASDSSTVSSCVGAVRSSGATTAGSTRITA